MPGPTGLSLALLAVFLWPDVVNGQSTVGLAECQECDTSRCPPLNNCPVDTVRDSCGCCDVCPQERRPPGNAPIEGACSQVQCPKFKVCKENIQGLPLCTCPALIICHTRKRRDICSTDGKTYASRCHLRIEACNTGRRIRVLHRGPCSPGEGADPENELFPKKKKKNKRRRRRRKKNKLIKIKKAKDRKLRRRQRKQQRKRKQNDQGHRRRRRDRIRGRRSRHSRRFARGQLRRRTEFTS